MGAAQGTPNNSPQLSQADVQFICANTDMSEEQAREAFARFMKDNPGGKITRESFREIMSLCYSGIENRNLEKHIFR